MNKKQKKADHSSFYKKKLDHVPKKENNNIIVYDINTNTNYNSTVEEKLRANGKQGASDKVVEFLSTLRG